MPVREPAPCGPLIFMIGPGLLLAATGVGAGDHLRRPFVAPADRLLARGDVSCSPKTDRVRRELLVLASPPGRPQSERLVPTVRLGPPGPEEGVRLRSRSHP
jgi:hypothetical protein